MLFDANGFRNNLSMCHHTFTDTHIFNKIFLTFVFIWKRYDANCFKQINYGEEEKRRNKSTQIWECWSAFNICLSFAYMRFVHHIFYDLLNVGAHRAQIVCPRKSLAWTLSIKIQARTQIVMEHSALLLFNLPIACLLLIYLFIFSSYFSVSHPFWPCSIWWHVDGLIIQVNINDFGENPEPKGDESKEKTKTNQRITWCEMVG